MSKLSPDQVDAIYQAARPLRPSDQVAFFQDVGAALVALDEIGDGVVHRVVRDAQRRHFDPPNLHETGTAPGRWPGRRWMNVRS